VGVAPDVWVMGNALTAALSVVEEYFAEAS
jgi:hypothetical protein